MGSFDDGIREVKELVGHGVLEGKLVVDQVYAHYQHERMDLKHPHGGQAKFLETALHTHAAEYFQGIADKILDGRIVQGMTDAVEQLDKDSGELTPKDLTILAHSGHPTVLSDGAVVYDRPPEVPRLSDAELEELHDFRDHPRARGIIGLRRLNRRRRS